MAPVCVGIDVAKAHLDVHLLPQQQRLHLPNDPSGWQELLEHLTALPVQTVVLEATGGYESLLVAELHAAGLPVAVVNPRQARDFARATGKLAKTDKLDAAVLAAFAQALRPRLTPVADATTELIKALVLRRRQLQQMHQAEANHREHVTDRWILSSQTRVLKQLDKELAGVEQRIHQLVQTSPLWQRRLGLLTAVPSIGSTTALALLAGVPELGTLNRRQVAALIGLAPINRDSGTLRGKRLTGGGRREVRKALYMPTLVAIRHNPMVKAFYQRLLANGKAKMTAVVACMRKLLTILNAILRTEKPWNPKCS